MIVAVSYRTNCFHHPGLAEETGYARSKGCRPQIVEARDPSVGGSIFYQRGMLMPRDPDNYYHYTEHYYPSEGYCNFERHSDGNKVSSLTLQRLEELADLSGAAL